jgi:hypothetical protein
MEAVEASRDIEPVRREFEELRSQIEVEIPRQARRAYLKERLNQVELNLGDTYREYCAITAELGAEHVSSSLDKRLQAVIEASIIPERRNQERRSAVISVLLALLLLTSVSPYSVSHLAYDYFNVLGYSDEWTDAGLYSTFALGTLVLAGVALLLATLLPGRVGSRLSVVANRSITPLIGMLFAAGLFAVSMIFRASAIKADHSIYYIDVASKETFAGFAFNFAALALAVALASGALIVVGALRRYRRINARAAKPTSTAST